MRQCRHRDASAGRPVGCAALRQRIGGRCVVIQAADAARDRPAGADGRADRDAGRRHAATARTRWAGAARHRFRLAGCQRAGQVCGAAGRSLCAGRDFGDRAASHPRLHRAHAVGVRRGDRFFAWQGPSARWTASARDRYRGTCGFFVGCILHRRGQRRSRLGSGAARGRIESAPHRAAGRVAPDGRRYWRRKPCRTRR